MNIKICNIVKRLRAEGDIGTANAIVDAFNITRRAKLMLKRAFKTRDYSPYYEDAQRAQARIDILLELFDNDDC